MFGIKNIRKSYGKHVVLDNVSLSVMPGEAVCVAGSNGCGKSTLFRIMAGVIKPDSGDLMYCIEGVYNISSAVLSGRVAKRCFFEEKVGFVPQDNPLIEELSVRDNLRFWYAGKPGIKSIADILDEPLVETLNISSYLDKKVSALSGGMKKRVSIACACGCHPEILIMDEPGASLDLMCKADIRKFINDYKASGGMIVFSSHEDEEIAMADRMAVIADGRLTELTRVLHGTELLNYIRSKSHE